MRNFINMSNKEAVYRLSKKLDIVDLDKARYKT